MENITTKSGKQFILNAYLKSKETAFGEIYEITDIDTMVEIIRDGCGDEFADLFMRLIVDYQFLNEEAMEANCFDSDSDSDSDIESDYDYDVASDHLHQVKELTNGLESKLKALTFGMGSKFDPILERIRKIRNLSEL